ncbi:hypothetical protein [Spiroplasma culicicola]|uniref:Lipoprotein n=1 Tax=Spiroplasma culicicola AES-1 TaxID=1276246 RepID=W6A7Z4_9MOLU|nr:hypothetical protein [Spiroplasma culicicola]AHI53243.1 hypothetical protein SCULI_v1c09030 [Spiroplasma culicicola AES-1]
MKKILVLLGTITITTSGSITVTSCGNPNENLKYYKYDFDILNQKYFYNDFWQDDYLEIINSLKLQYPARTFIKESELNDKKYKFSQQLQTIFVVKIVYSSKHNQIYVEQYNSDDKISWNKQYSYLTNISYILSLNLNEQQIIYDFNDYLRSESDFVYSELSNVFAKFIYEKNGFDISGISYNFVLVDKTGKQIKEESTLLDTKTIDILSIETPKNDNYNSMFIVWVDLDKQSDIKYNINNLDSTLVLDWNNSSIPLWKKHLRGLKTFISLKMEEIMANDLTINNSFDFRKYILSNPENIVIEFRNSEGRYLTEENYNEESIKILCENDEIYVASILIISPIDNYLFLIEGVSNITLEYTL